jgi:3',5'-nucleoside bisphosphate phosphatase
MEANLHLHSRYSDGTLWPEEIASAAAASGLELVALTDHDSLGGTRDFAVAAEDLGLASIAGCEIDCLAPEIDYRSEILGYFPGGSYANTEALLAALLRRRSERLQAYIESSRRVFRRSDLSFEDLLLQKFGSGNMRIKQGGISLSKVDLFLYLRERRVIDEAVDYREFRKSYLDSGLVDGPSMARTGLAEVADSVLKDGGFLVLPHIGHEFEDDARSIADQKKRLRSMLDHFKNLGVSGLELYWYRSPSTNAINELVAKEADRLGLFVTYGSDCHGPGSGKHTLGKYSGDFRGFPRLPLPPSTRKKSPSNLEE